MHQVFRKFLPSSMLFYYPNNYLNYGDCSCFVEKLYLYFHQYFFFLSGYLCPIGHLFNYYSWPTVKSRPFIFRHSRRNFSDNPKETNTIRST